jgi:MoaA/NifB/PqqE/SkfB family radical SAM enzyme
MYKTTDYLTSGLLYVNNTLRPHHKQLSQLMIYATTACQSRCHHCSIWKKPHEHLSFDDIVRVMQSSCVRPYTTVGLEGGEFILHPQANQILEWFSLHHPNYTLLSNCLAPERLIESTRLYKPSHLYLSLDGDRQTYLHMRGCDGYLKVMKVIEVLAGVVPLSLMFCLSPWNKFEDMEYVIRIAQQYQIDVRIGIYGTMAFFDTTTDLLAAKDFTTHIPQSIHQTSENYDYVALYDQWRNGGLTLPCLSIRNQAVIHANGNVPLCQNLDCILGNIHNQSFDDIWNSPTTCSLQRHYGKTCNGCWINFHRKYDIILLRTLERFLPKRVVELLYGSYQWCDYRSTTYRQYFKTIQS